MVTQHGIKYAVHLITTHFGDLVAKVCECLLRKGPSTLQAIVRFTELTSSQVKNSLLVLIQHNCVQAFILEQPGSHGDGAKLNTHYIALFDNIIHRWRFPKFLTIVSQKLDKQCVALIEALLLHGRLTLKQMSDRAKSAQNEGDDAILDAVREAFIKLLNAHFVERCPAAEPVLTKPTEAETSTRKRGPKSAKILEEKETLEQRVLEAAAPSEALRFLLVTQTEPGADGGKDENNSSSMTVGEKRKLDALESDTEGGATDEQVVLWRANFEEYIRRLRHKAFIENVRACLDDGAVIVISAMLEATRTAEKKVKTENSGPLSLNSIYEEVIKSEEGRNITFDRVRASLVQLSCPPFVKAVNELYSIDFKKIIELAQNDEVESIVLKRYGRDAYRMFRLLSNTGRLLETDKIADTAFVEKKDTPKILYKLWKDDYLHMEKLQLTGARQSQFLLWKVNKNTLWEHVLDEMFHAALNLSLRVAHELEQEKELLNLPQDKRVNRLRKVRLLLESSQMKLDDAIMLFHDF
ncbi:DNA-directed RNA polymerase III subunit RPC3 [Herrania umbratica]|uniref:DNA-directed RNA polymerase III subunit RPC3 n=1 Tax=Herrania umbratica TaxID=108875 RepID=A0A6J1A2U6_9ROSI|nr:DNA-directed RNA polymerase III subunit RPC3 [Herrania umbratica]